MSVIGIVQLWVALGMLVAKYARGLIGNFWKLEARLSVFLNQVNKLINSQIEHLSVSVCKNVPH